MALGAIFAGAAAVKMFPDFTGFGPAVAAGVTKTTRSLTTIGAGLTKAVTLPVLAIGAAAVKTHMDFDTAFSRIAGLVGVPAPELENMRQAVLELGPAVGKGPVELAEALYFVTSSGFKGAAALDVLEVSARAATAGLGDTQVVADALTSAMNAYGHENLTAARAADIMVAAVREGKIEADAMAQHMGTLVPTAAALGISFEDVAGSLAVLSRTGTDAAEGATQISAVMSSLLSTSPKVTKALRSVGLSQAELRDVAAGPQGLIGVFRLLDERFQGNEEAMRQVFPNIRAFRALMNGLAQNAGEVDKVINGVTNSTGSLDTAFGAAEETARVKFDSAISALKGSLIIFGGAIAPIITAIATGFAWLVTAISGLPGPLRGAIAVFLGIVAAVGPVLLIVAKIGTTFQTLVPVLRGVFTAIRLMSSALFANPILLAIAGIIIATILIIKHWDKVKAALSAVWNAIKKAAGVVFGWLKTLFLNFTPVGLIIKHWDSIKKFLGEVWEAIKRAASRLWGAIRTAVVDPVKEAAKWVIDKFGELKDKLREIWDAIKRGARKAWDAITGVIKEAIDKVKGPIDKLKGAASWLLPGSPVPLVVGLEKSAKALRALGNTAKAVNVPLATPALATAGAGSLLGGSDARIVAGLASLQTEVRQLRSAMRIELDGRVIADNSNRHNAYSKRATK